MKKPIGLKLDPKVIEMLKGIATRQHRSLANMVETLIANEYNKNMKENETMNIKTIIEHLGEMGKVVIDMPNFMSVKLLQQELSSKGYETRFESTDRDYLVLIK